MFLCWLFGGSDMKTFQIERLNAKVNLHYVCSQKNSRKF